jgi:hypothetical protein
VADPKNPEPLDQDLIDLLRARDATLTIVRLASGESLSVWNIAWGYDFYDAHAHVTTNISPSIDGEAFDFFFTHEVLEVVDPLSDQLLWPEG